MHATVTSAAVMYAKDLALLSDFYAAVGAMDVIESESGHVVLQAKGFQLVVVAIPPHIAATIQISSPPVAREDSPIKLVFLVGSIEAAAVQVARRGGHMNPAERSWQFRGATVLDGCDPEGNVFQLRQPAL
jgi:hypothetical protein